MLDVRDRQSGFSRSWRLEISEFVPCAIDIALCKKQRFPRLDLPGSIRTPRKNAVPQIRLDLLREELHCKRKRRASAHLASCSWPPETPFGAGSGPLESG